MDHAVVANRRGFHARFVELSSIGFSLVAENVVLGDLDQRGRQAFQLLEARAQRRRMDVRSLRGVGNVHVVHPLHERGGKEAVPAELTIRFGLEVGVEDRPHQDL